MAAAVSCLVMLAIAAPARADDPKVRAAARELGAEAMHLFDKGEWAEALDRFERANALVPAPTLLVRAARCLVKLGRLVEGAERYLDATRIPLAPNPPAVHFQARREAQLERDALMPTIPRLVVEVSETPPDLVLVLDGKKMPSELVGASLPVDPGEHEVVMKRGTARVARRVTLALRDHVTVALDVPAAPVPPEVSGWEGLSDWKRAGVVVTSVGGGILLVGMASGVAALVEDADLRERCPDRNCPPDAHGAVDAYDAARVFTTFGLVAGSLGLATGTVLLLTRPDSFGPGGSVEQSPGPDGDEARGPSLSVGLGPLTVQIAGRF